MAIKKDVTLFIIFYIFPPSLAGDSKAQELFIFLKGLASMQENVMKGEVSGVENIRVMSALATKDAAAWKWKVS